MNEELIALIISLRPKGIEPEAIPYFVQLIENYLVLKRSQKD